MTDVVTYTAPPTFAEAVCDLLKQDPQLSQMLMSAGGKIRIYPHDMRAVGWGRTPEVFDEDGLMLSAMCVDDTGGIPVIDAQDTLVSDVFLVWAFADRTRQGHREIESMMNRVRYVLHGRMLDGVLLRHTNRLGRQDDDDGSMDRMMFTATGDYLAAQ